MPADVGQFAGFRPRQPAWSDRHHRPAARTPTMDLRGQAPGGSRPLCVATKWRQK